LSRFEGDFSAAGQAPLSRNELLDLLAASTAMSSDERQQAIACYLSASEGWHEAMKALRGAFATDAAAAVKLGGAKNVRDINQRASEYLQWQSLKPTGSDND
jgi:hypothetical protein